MKILIIGGGIAGTALAQHCIDYGITCRLIEKGNNQSSVVAGGIINPLVFRRMTLSWRADELIPFARKFYRVMEERLGKQFFHELIIRRLFASGQESEYWQQKQHLGQFTPYMCEQTDEDVHFPSSLNTFGTARVKGAAWIDAPVYCQAQLDFLRSRSMLSESIADYSDIDPEKGTYAGETYDFIVFAEGKDGRRNPWFGYLPLQQTKGELLTVHAPTVSQSEQLNRKCFMLPIGNGNFRVGSTYAWDTDNVIPTAEGKEAILANMASVTQEPFEVTGHVAGVRPTVTDRRPLFGRHPQFPKLVIANGLGTKGYMIAPLLTKELLDHLCEGSPIAPEASIARFAHKLGL